MNLVALTTILTTVLSVIVKVVGLPDQIRSNHRRQSTEGLSDWFMICTLLSYGMWVVHGVQVHDEALVIGQGLGVIASGIILYQAFIYRKNRQSKKKSRPVMLWLYARLNTRQNVDAEKSGKVS